jgi:hypothetical protein
LWVSGVVSIYEGWGRDRVNIGNLYTNKQSQLHRERHKNGRQVGFKNPKHMFFFTDSPEG